MDITRTDPTAYVCAIHWQVSQGTSLENIDFYMMQDDTTTHQVRTPRQVYSDCVRDCPYWVCSKKGNLYGVALYVKIVSN